MTNTERLLTVGEEWINLRERLGNLGGKLALANTSPIPVMVSYT